MWPSLAVLCHFLLATLIGNREYTKVFIIDNCNNVLYTLTGLFTMYFLCFSSDFHTCQFGV